VSSPFLSFLASVFEPILCPALGRAEPISSDVFTTEAVKRWNAHIASVPDVVLRMRDRRKIRNG
jgi:hypothetical protein